MLGGRLSVAVVAATLGGSLGVQLLVQPAKLWHPFLTWPLTPSQDGVLRSPVGTRHREAWGRGPQALLRPWLLEQAVLAPGSVKG